MRGSMNVMEEKHLPVAHSIFVSIINHRRFYIDRSLLLKNYKKTGKNFKTRFIAIFKSVYIKRLLYLWCDGE